MNMNAAFRAWLIAHDATPQFITYFEFLAGLADNRLLALTSQRARQAKYKQKQRSRDVSADVTADVSAKKRNKINDLVQWTEKNRPLKEDSKNLIDSKKEEGTLLPFPGESLTLRPIPTVGSRARATGHRLPMDWQPSAADVEFARELISQQWHVERDRFRDYWHGKPGAAGRKVDWSATWRNWVRKASEQRGAANGRIQKTTREKCDELAAEFRAREDAALRGDNACPQDAFSVSGQRDMFDRLHSDANGRVVQFSTDDRSGGMFPDSWDSEGMQIIPPNGPATR